MKIVLCSLILSPSIVMASGSAGHGSPSDLIAPAVNIAILVGFLVWKLKGPFSTHFVNKANSVSEVMERASVKAKEAEMMMAMQKKKMDGSDAEVSKIASDVDNDVAAYKSAYEKEVAERIAKLKVDAASKVEAEMQSLTNELNTLLLDKVISDAKNMIKEDKNLNNEVTEKIIAGL